MDTIYVICVCIYIYIQKLANVLVSPSTAQFPRPCHMDRHRDLPKPDYSMMAGSSCCGLLWHEKCRDRESLGAISHK